MDEEKQDILTEQSGRPAGPDVQPSPSRICVIDLGTNSFHALIVDVMPNGTFSVVDKIKEMVRLGERGMVQHRLTEAAMRRGLNALGRIKMLADGWGATKYVTFATSAIREAENGGEFIVRVRAEHDILIRTIDGDLEAELIYKAVRRAKDIPEPSLLVDIGGGSSEFIIGTNSECLFRTSIKLGAARMTERFVSTDPVNRQELKRLQDHCRKSLEPVLKSARKHGVKHVVGSSGTMENLISAVIQQTGGAASQVFHRTVSAKVVRDITKKIIGVSRAEREQIPGIDARRVDQIVAGAVLLGVIVEDLGIETVAVSPDALREGMVQHFIEENHRTIQQLGHFTSVRRRSVYELAYRFRWDEGHAMQVTELALALFDGCYALHGLGERERELLEYAAILHDIGNLVSYSSHHKHAIYLIRNAGLNGFSPDEIDVIANVARYHRKSMPKKTHTDYARLSRENREVVNKLASFLRMANGLDRSHVQNVSALHTTMTERTLQITIETRGDPQLELWAGRRSSDLFRRTFQREVEVVARPGVKAAVESAA